MSQSLNVIALISGGKDSLYSILHCVQNGHKVVALANLRPPGTATGTGTKTETEPGTQTGDLDSMMYQTVGHQVIPLYAEALDLPLYRQVIKGTAAQSGQDYDTSSNNNNGAGPDPTDEIEDLFALLQEVKGQHPEANALCSGAILSTYQRTRVESVALRLGLVPLAYLWQYPKLPPPEGGEQGQDGGTDSVTGLLDDMALAGCEARIIKTASAGIPERMVWSNVADARVRRQLVSGMAPFFYPRQDQGDEAGLRSAVLGEGGEYETLAVCGPPAVWKKRIEIDPDQIKTVSEPGGACYALLPPASLVPNQAMSSSETPPKDIVRRPGMFDPQFRRIVDEVQPVGSRLLGNEVSEQASVVCLEGFGRGDSPIALLGQAAAHGAHIVLANETAPAAGDDAARQMEGVYSSLQHKLETQSGPDQLTMSSAVFCLLLLANMDDFGAVNAVYARMFPEGQPNPPARVTVAVDFLPAKVKLSLSVIVDARSRSSRPRKGLHVQSRSYWAPANIGPYSQAINEALTLSTLASGERARARSAEQAEVEVAPDVDAEIVHLAGQIPLIAHTMRLSDQSFVRQAILSLQHLWRVGQERGVDLWPWGVAFLASASASASASAGAGAGAGSSVISANARTADWVWKQAHRRISPHDADTQDDEDGEDEEFDVWDRSFGKYASASASATDTFVRRAAAGQGQHLHAIPNVDVLSQHLQHDKQDKHDKQGKENDSSSSSSRNHNDVLSDLFSGQADILAPPLVVANVASLPLGASIEWWSTGLARLSQGYGYGSDGSIAGAADDDGGGGGGGMKIKTVSQLKSYGALHMTILTRAGSHTPTTTTIFTAVLVFVSATATATSHQPAQTPESSQPTIIDIDSAIHWVEKALGISRRASPVEVIDGTVFVTPSSSSCSSSFSRNESQSGRFMDVCGGVACVPCTSLFGSTAAIDRDCSQTTLSSAPVPLRAAYLLRLETTAPASTFTT